jgi:hypothetical protein
VAKEYEPERSLKLTECSLKLTEHSLKLTERSLKLTERSLKLTERYLKLTERFILLDISPSITPDSVTLLMHGFHSHHSHTLFSPDAFYARLVQVLSLLLPAAAPGDSLVLDHQLLRDRAAVDR